MAYRFLQRCIADAEALAYATARAIVTNDKRFLATRFNVQDQEYLDVLYKKLGTPESYVIDGVGCGPFGRPCRFTIVLRRKHNSAKVHVWNSRPEVIRIDRIEVP